MRTYSSHLLHFYLVRVAVLLAAAACFLMLPAPGNAATLSPADEKSVRAVIQAQIAAFAKDDAHKAFSYVAPNVRETMGSAAVFLAVVRSEYPMIYRPTLVAFLKPEGKNNLVIQRVQMLDASGDAWLAIYSLQRSKGKVWRITGCVVMENKGRMA